MVHDQGFVGRDEELRRLHRFYDEALEGRATICFVAGEPGSGKSALVDEFAVQVQARDEHVVVARGSCNAQTGVGDPYLPFREILIQLVGDVEDEVEQGRMTEENASRLRRLAELSAQALVESAPDLIGLLVPGGSLLARLGAKVTEDVPWARKLRKMAKQRPGNEVDRTELDQNRVFEQVTDVLRTLARRQPLILLVDDLQWADQASIGLLFHLARRLGVAEVLVVGAYRPADVAVGRAGERHPLESVLNEIRRYEGDVWIDLDTEGEQDRRDLLEELVDLVPNRLDETFRDALYQRTEGHPLFTLELFRHMQEEGHLHRDDDGNWTAARRPRWERLPVRVEGVIGERLARLDEDLREALEVGSVEGERFRAQIVARVLDREARPLVRRLGTVAAKKHRIVRSEGLRRLAGQRLAEYRFSHNLFQTYLYDALDEGQRAFLHEEVGEILEGLFEEKSREIALDLARHFERAGVAEKAMRYYEQAAEKALELFATGEAILHFRKALSHLELLPEGEERDRRELELQLQLGACLVGAEGYAAPEVRTTYERARVLCARLGLETDAPPILRALAIANIVAAEHAEAFALGEELLRLARDDENRLLVVEGHYVLGVSAFWLGRLADSRKHLEEALAHYDPDQRDVHIALYAQDPGVICLCRLAWTLWHLGYPEQALEKMEDSLTRAEAIGHLHTHVYALSFAAELFLAVQETDRAAGTLEELAALGEPPDGSAFWYHKGMILQGWMRGREGAVSSGIEQMQQEMDAYADVGAVLGFPQEFGRLGMLHLADGSVEDGLDALSEAFERMERTDERYYEPELHRIRGKLRMASDDTDAAEASFRRALDVARERNAGSYALRAAMSLGRLWERRGETDRARQVVREVYRGFTEGFDTPDLVEARALLDRWGATESP